MDVSSISSYLDLQKQFAKEAREKSDTDFNSILEKAMTENNTKEIKEACNQVESYMISQIFKQMKEAMLSNIESEKGDYETAFMDTYINSLADQMVEAGGIGLSDFMYKQMTASYVNTKNGVVDISGNQAAIASGQVKINQEV